MRQVAQVLCGTAAQSGTPRGGAWDTGSAGEINFLFVYLFASSKEYRMREVCRKICHGDSLIYEAAGPPTLVVSHRCRPVGIIHNKIA